MGRRGPKPEPASVKRAKGNPGRRPVGEDPALGEGLAETEAQAQVVVTPPDWLKGEGLKVWEQLASRQVAMKLLTQTDAIAFARYCRSLARWTAMQRKIDEDGLTYHVVSKHGEWDRPHPLLLPADRLEVRLQAFEDKFGLNPAERQRIFAARAAQPKTGDFFGAPAPAPAKPAQPSERGAPVQPDNPVGFLN